MNALQLVERLEGVRSTGPHRWIAKCPAHDDRSPSLAVKEADDGTVLVKCFGGCGATEVVSALGLSLKDLFPERPPDHRHKSSRHGLTLVTCWRACPPRTNPRVRC